MLIFHLILVLTCSITIGQPSDESVETPSRSAPPLPAVENPVDFFRQLLAANTHQRDAWLQDRSAWQRRQIELGLREYSALSAPAREHRLRLLELRYYLLKSLKQPDHERESVVMQAPHYLQRTMRERLVYWDELPAELRNVVLNFETELRQMAHSRGEESNQPRPPLPPLKISQSRPGIDAWNRLSNLEKEILLQRFQSFFNLPRPVQNRSLDQLNPANRQYLMRLLQALNDHSDAERQRLLAAFAEFADLEASQKTAFLENARTWLALSPSTRAVWREMIPHQPPLPPGFESPPVPLVKSNRPPHPGIR